MLSKTTINFGRLIKNRRYDKDWSISFCARRLKVKPEHLRAIEHNHRDQLPANINPIKIVADYLQMLGFSAKEATPIINHWRNGDQQQENDVFSRHLIRKRDLWSYPHIVRNILIVLAIAVVAIYIIFSVKNIVAPPKLMVTSPASDLVTKEKQISIVGYTEPEVQLEINGETLLSDRSGNFNQLINLRSGINNLSVTAVKKYGGQTTVVRQIMVVDD